MTPSLPVRVAVTVLAAWVVAATPVTAQREVGRASGAVRSGRVVILPFGNISGAPDDEWMGAGIAETLTADLQDATGFDVVDRTFVLGVTRATDVDNEVTRADGPALEVGRRVGARWVVSGGYQRLGDQLRITARLVDVATGTLVRAIKVDGAIDDLFTLQDRLAVELVTGTKERPPRPRRASGRSAPRAPTSPPLAGAASEGSAAATPVARGAGRTLPSDGVVAAPASNLVARDEDGRVTVQGIRLTEPLRIDGQLNELVYQSVSPLTDFIQALPNEGAPATERTEAWVMFDRDNIYVAARCWDSTPPSRWVANELRRDGPQLVNNDNFGVMFDTFHDRRNGFTFYTNPLGALADFTTTDEGQINRDWNPVWQVRTGRFEGGWTVEMAIPFKSLRYISGLSHVWGLQLRRAIRRKNEWTYLNPVPASVGDARGIARISVAGSLVGLELPDASKNVELKPYAISRLTTDRPTAVSNALEADFGVDVKYGVTANLTADLTYNTDFAQVEVDEQQVNLTRFSLFFPEKREFFLEGRGLFDFGRGAAPTLFHSRRIGLNNNRIVPIDFGGRLTGKVGQVGLGVLSIQTDAESVSATPATNFTVARVKLDILQRSSIGVLFASRSRSVTAAGSNQTYGVDAAFSFFQDLNLGGYYSKTETPGLEGDDESYQARFDYAGDRYGAQVGYLAVGDNFNPEVGFVRRDDFKRTTASLRFSPRPRSIAVVRKFTWEGGFEYIANGAGHLETRQQTGRFNIEFENSDRFSTAYARSFEFLERPFPIAPDVTIPVGSYGFQDVQASFTFGPQRRLSGTVSVQHGSFFSGEKTTVGFTRGRLELTPQFSLEPSVSYNRVDLPEGRFTTTLVRTRSDYAFSPRMFTSALVQYSSSDNLFSSNLRFRWEYHPGSELFVVYTEDRGTLGTGFPVLKNRAFVIKINRLLRF